MQPLCVGLDNQLFCLTKETQTEEENQTEDETQTEELSLWVLEDDNTVPTSTVIGKESFLNMAHTVGFWGHLFSKCYEIPLATPTMFT